LTLCDAHLHFFSKGVLNFYARQVDGLKEAPDPAAAAAQQLGIEPPPAEPEALAARWIAELDRHGVRRAALFGSAPGEAGAIARAVRAFPERFVPLQMVNPRSADAAGVGRDLVERGIRGMLLFPALHGYFPDDAVCLPLYEAARQHRLVVFIHVGQLKIALRDRLRVPGTIDSAYGDPMRLTTVLHEFADVRFIVPHFGSGTLGELLPAIRGARNLSVDTSSSNAWTADTPAFPTLEAALRAVLECPDLGPEKILFGSDSTVFPRGWRADVHEQQVAALDAIGAPGPDREAIFSGNFERLFA
jgi:predicted TIM-barrel fold metal-dependent hydrolase